MSGGIPYFSNLSSQWNRQRVQSPLHTTSRKDKNFSVIGLGLPTQLKSTPKSKTNILSEIFPQTQTQPQGILATAETSAVIDRDFAEINKAKFFDLASTETVKNISKLAQSTSVKFNSLKRSKQASVQGPTKTKKKKPDIFDS